MSVELTPKEVDLFYRFSECPEIELDEETKSKFIRAINEGFTAKMGLRIDSPRTVKRIANIQAGTTQNKSLGD